MSTAPEQINAWLRVSSEHQRLEFKSGDVDSQRLFEYCVAIANEGGGHLVVGVSDALPRRVVGTRSANDPIGMSEKLYQVLGFRVDVEAVIHPKGRVVIYGIPSRPRGTAYALEGRYLMRSGSTLVSMSEDRLRRIFDEGKPDWLEEYSRKGLDPQQIVELLDTQTFFELLKLPYPTERAGVIDRLAGEGIINAIAGEYAIRRLGALLLAKRLDDFPDISRKALRVIVYSGSSKLETHLDQLGARGYAVGFAGLLGFVMAQLPQNEIIEGALRRDVKLVPENAIRELLANALIHQDFTVMGASAAVEIYGDRIEISNPGEPVVPVERFIDGYESRNERLAKLMRRFGICEEKGSGIDRVVTIAELFQLPAPDFSTTFQRTVVTIYGPRPFEGMDRLDRIRACYQHCVLKYVMREPMTNQSLRERFKLPEEKSAVVSQIISAAIDAGKIKRDVDAGNARKYVRYLPNWA